jgi:hypothetical protein
VDSEFAEVILMEHQCSYIYSNPTGMFNLSVPTKLYKQPNFQSISYKAYKTFIEKKKLEEAGQPSEDVEIPLVVKNIKDDGAQGGCVMKVLVKSKA